MTNFEKLHHYFKDFESPEQFITWGYYYMIASCLGRKVWMQKSNPVYPNIAAVLVGPPGVGKTQPSKILADVLRNLMIPVQPITNPPSFKNMVHVTPQRITLEKLYLNLANSINFFNYEGKKHCHSSACFFLADEMGLLFKRETLQELVMFINAGYDCSNKLDYDTKKNGTDVINNVCINFFGCTTPDWISRNLPASVIGDGWSSRVFFVYGEAKRKLTTYINFDASQNQCLEGLKKHFRAVALLTGEVAFSPEAKEYFENWYLTKSQKEIHNKDPKLEHYYSRKKIHLWKIATNIHFSEKLDMVITLDELKQAFAFLAFTEADMHKGLASVNQNPTARLAEDILRSVKCGPAEGLTRIQLIAKLYSVAIGGTGAIDEAINFLMITSQIIMNADKYIVVQKIINHDFTINDEEQSNSSPDLPDVDAQNLA